LRIIIVISFCPRRRPEAQYKLFDGKHIELKYELRSIGTLDSELKLMESFFPGA